MSTKRQVNDPPITPRHREPVGGCCVLQHELTVPPSPRTFWIITPVFLSLECAVDDGSSLISKWLHKRSPQDEQIVVMEFVMSFLKISQTLVYSCWIGWEGLQGKRGWQVILVASCIPARSARKWGQSQTMWVTLSVCHRIGLLSLVGLGFWDVPAPCNRACQRDTQVRMAWATSESEKVQPCLQRAPTPPLVCSWEAEIMNELLLLLQPLWAGASGHAERTRGSPKAPWAVPSQCPWQGTSWASGNYHGRLVYPQAVSSSPLINPSN